MKTLRYGLVSLMILGTQLLTACPFRFVNDGQHRIVILDTRNGKKHFAGVGKTIKIPGAVAEASLWVYGEDPIHRGTYTPRFGISEDHCLPEDAPMVVLRASALAQRVGQATGPDGFSIVQYDANTYPNLLPSFAYRSPRETM